MTVPVTNGLVLHLDADAIEGLNDNDLVQTWSDLSGTGNHATQATEANRPTYKTNILDGKPVVRFSQPDETSLHVANNATLNGLEHLNAFVVIKPTTPQEYDHILEKRNSFLCWFLTSDWAFFIRTDGIEGVKNYDLWRDEFQQSVTTDPALINWVWSSATEKANIYKNGTAGVEQDVVGDYIATSTTPLVIGGRVHTEEDNRHFTGDIAEIIIYNRALSTAEREQVEQYLGVKWLGWTPSFTTGYILERRIGEGEWVEIARLPVGSVGQLQEPLTLSGTLNTEEQKIIVEGR